MHGQKNIKLYLQLCDKCILLVRNERSSATVLSTVLTEIYLGRSISKQRQNKHFPLQVILSLSTDLWQVEPQFEHPVLHVQSAATETLHCACDEADGNRVSCM